VELRSE
jgi:ATP-binding cassette, subfamily G (WHITE), member 2, SNQ2